MRRTKLQPRDLGFAHAGAMKFPNFRRSAAAVAWSAQPFPLVARILGDHLKRQAERFGYGLVPPWEENTAA